MDVSYSTEGTAAFERKRYWDEAVSSTYFPLDLRFQNAQEFSGELNVWDLGNVSLSRLESDGLLYRRQKRHLLHEREESYLITVPEKAEISFEQSGKAVTCKPGAFLVERSHLPYEFSYSAKNTLWVLKVPIVALRTRVGLPERIASLSFDSTRGTGALFVDMIRLVAPRLVEMDASARDMTGKHLVDILAMSLTSDERMLTSDATSVQLGHLHRVESFVRANLARGDLGPQTIADACGISVRYLHQLMKQQGTSVCHWIRLQRLLRCDEMLRDPACRKLVSEIAYALGFGDHAQLSRHYKAHFGLSPTDARERYLTERPAALG
ncbi:MULTISPECIES: helix-turn-helix domain-containing protein [unclassified Ensifer]|uniref:AraC-like ligand-binding domain-containing protein n=1 Tax=unclassified Ensifer TaxID=2633371 RepID=UPI00300FB77E